ncbi:MULTISPECIES: MFS transporter [Micrococcus]|uniref:MFS transporter n=2 Tax=Micrococcus TaxID=1269 RepID=A0AAP5WDX0_9MICC|nr:MULTISPECIES: MFS transporter [Micrococcus]MBA9080251.1 MFS family permease [Micrococcus aloeverae]MDV7178095.1 MFS transporter [Micrococcus yunnanensis]MEB2536189.1 MFS transporter [Micrococcus luteus]
MLAVLRNPTYARLFSAQIIALLGTGLLTVALGLLAYDIAGSDAGAVMGTVMAIKMVAYVLVSPVTTALVSRLPARRVLIGADLVRAGVAVSLPFVTEAWQTYMLIFLLQSASATFTPTFQAVIPSVLPDEREYTRALSLSRLAYDLESLLSPLLAAALLTVTAYNNLFFGTVIGFLVSAALVALARFPAIQAPEPAPFLDRLTRGTQAYWARLELRGLLGVNLVVATTTAMVIVNTVVLVQADLGRPQQDVALLLAAYGGGSMLVALGLPRVLDAVPDRRVMLAGAAALPVLLLAAVGAMSGLAGGPQWAALLVLWALMGAATAAVLTPSARLLRRNSTEQNRPAVFAAQFSLSHACFLLTYPLAGLLGARIGLPAVGLVLVGIGAAGLVLTVLAWRRADSPAPAGR